MRRHLYRNLPPMNKRTLFSAVILLATLAVFVVSVSAHEDEHTFTDVKDTHKNMPAIEYLVSIGTLQGYDDGTFKPGNTVNRAEIMKILVKGQGIDPDPSLYKDCFPDVTDEWFATSVCYAEAEGWVNGYLDGTFKPANTVNKVEAIKMLVNALGLDDRLPDSVTEALFDDTDSSQWYAPYLKVAKNLNLLEISSGNFNPTAGMNRAGISENIFRTLVSKDNALEAYTEENRNAFLASAGLGNLVGVQEDEPNEDTETSETVTDETAEEEAEEPAGTIVKSFDLTARQWTFTPDTITVQQGDTVHFTITSEDVAHGFFLPEFNVSETLSPGQVTEAEFVADQKGTFTFSCNVFCGSGHSQMNGTLVVE